MKINIDNINWDEFMNDVYIEEQFPPNVEDYKFSICIPERYFLITDYPVLLALKKMFLKMKKENEKKQKKKLMELE